MVSMILKAFDTVITNIVGILGVAFGMFLIENSRQLDVNYRCRRKFSLKNLSICRAQLV